MATHDQEAGWARPSDVRGSSEAFREFPSGKGADDAGMTNPMHAFHAPTAPAKHVDAAAPRERSSSEAARRRRRARVVVGALAPRRAGREAEDAAARFLSRATFGPTRAEIGAFAETHGSSPAACPSVARTFLNEATCVRSPGCGAASFAAVDVVLNETALRAIHEASGAYVYAVDGLRSRAAAAPFVLAYPASHAMDRWADNKAGLAYVGTYGDAVPFTSLPATLQTVAVGEAFGAVATYPDEGFEACGSPGEVANDPALGNRYAKWLDRKVVGSGDDPDDRDGLEVTLGYGPSGSANAGKQVVWYETALFAADQLRQRCAWALAQVYVVSDGDPPDVLREISYSPLMARYLTFHGNARFDGHTYPDENYARAHAALHHRPPRPDDGGAADAGAPAYGTDHILDYSRVWTGFESRPIRRNIEVATLDGGYLGDRAPLCADAPPRPFLRKNLGSFVYQGTSPVYDGNDEAAWADLDHLVLDPATSALYAALCARGAGAACAFPSSVVLSADLDCDGDECGADAAPRPARGRRRRQRDARYYRYVPDACVELAYFADARVVTPSSSGRQYAQAATLCADPRTASASVLCCDADDGRSNTRACAFPGERTTFATAAARCAATRSDDDGAAPLAICGGPASFHRWGTPGGCDYGNDQPFWRDAPCALLAQVDAAGRVAAVHGGAAGWDLQPDSGNAVPRWDGGAYPGRRRLLRRRGCEARGETCLCNVTVAEAAVFAARRPPATRPRSSPASTSAPSSRPRRPGDLRGARGRRRRGVVAYGAGAALDADAVFEVVDDFGATLYLANKRSTVSLAGFSFRNPPQSVPQYNKLAEPNERDAAYETEALIDHLFRHANAGPFLAYRMIQRLTSSNPSPRYVRAAVDAFRTGAYGGTTYSGAYGDLGALFAAVLLDREATSDAVYAAPARARIAPSARLRRERAARDDDPSRAGGGAIRAQAPTAGAPAAPLKVAHVLRSLEYATRDGREVELADLVGRIGEEPHKMPSVFNFYQPEYAGAGENFDFIAGQSVETTLANSLVDLGGTSCDHGFGPSLRMGRACGKSDFFAYAANYDGNLTALAAAPAASAREAVDDLDLLLAAGRLSNHTRRVVVAAPEFHATNAHAVDAGSARHASRRVPIECNGTFAATNFTSNSASGAGGAVLKSDQGHVAFEGARLDGNAAGDDGGAVKAYGGNPASRTGTTGLAARASTFASNTAARGGAIAISKENRASPTDVAVDDAGCA
ncbi:DUF1800-containing protein [Aureococcus anophagefferens]|nr:DUF1800-containing protein [Aureococcus anophagefferens]